MTENRPTLTRTTLFRSTVKGISLGVIVSAIFMGGYFYRGTFERPVQSPEPYALLTETDTLLSENFLGDLPDDQTRIHGAASGLVASLKDPHTFFVEPQQAELDSNRLAGSFGGIGMELGRGPDGSFVFARVYRNGPAASAGVLTGDLLVAIDGVSVNHSEPDDRRVQAALAGDVGTSVSITVLRASEHLEFNITRAKIVVPSVFWQLNDEEARIGQIQVTGFGDRTPAEVKEAILELRNSGVTALVLDLRNNGGGLVDSAVEVVSEFLDGGPILYERRTNGSEQIIIANVGGSALDIPLAVLINVNTASAAEIVGGALQDRDRAILIGQKTYGKGTVQVIFALSDGSSLHITTAEWLTPNRHKIEGAGLTPDKITEIIDGRDVEMEVAVSTLLNVLSK